jgi:hypothetical protein
VGDFSGNGWQDILLEDTQTGQLKLWQMTGGDRPSLDQALDLTATVPAGWDLAAVADYNGDGTPDLLLQNRQTAAVAVWDMRGGNVMKQEALPLADVLGALVGASDDSDGNLDLLWRKGGSLLDTAMQGGRVTGQTAAGSLPDGWVVADTLHLSGAAMADVLIANPRTGEVRYLTPAGPSLSVTAHPLDLGGSAGEPMLVQRAGEAPAGPQDDPNSWFVRQLYLDVLGRAADQAGFDTWVGILRAGGSRQQVVQGIWDSPEHRGLEVDGFYTTYLHRAADAAGRAFWVNALLGGASEGDLARGFLTSAEYQQAHASTTAYLSGLYADVLGRTPDPGELDVWQAAPQGGMSRAALADAFLGAGEADQQLIDRYYSDYPGRAAEPARVAYWLGALQSRQASTAQVAQALLASDEYFSRAGATGGTAGL